MEDRREPVSSPTPDPRLRVPDHELIRLIGRGSYGEVWLGRNALGTYRAIKLVYEKTFRHKRPFDREFNGVQKFEPISRSHDGLVDILQVGRDDAAECFYYVMELADDVVNGESIDPENYSPRTLAHDVVQHTRLPIEECRRVGVAIASALDFLHGRGLIHRDVKPSNIVFVGGVPKLADIGLVAEMSEARSYVGTEGFIPPEGPGTVRADLYSLGKVLYEISTGKDRHEYPEPPTLLDEPGREEEWRQLNRVILKACRADPRVRYQSALAMKRDLQLSAGSEAGGFANRARRAAYRLAIAAAAAFGIVAIVRSMTQPTKLAPAPQNCDPLRAPAGTRVTISGTRFNPSPAGNLVYFGGVRGEVLSVTPTNLTTKVPAGATYAPVAVIGANGFVTYGHAPFLPTFAGGGATISTGSFAARLNLPSGNGPCHSTIADFDGDGRPDLAFANWDAHTVSIYRHAGVRDGFVAFDAPVLIPVGTGRSDPLDVAAADVDGDGKIDLIVPDRDADRILIFRNVSEPGILGTNSFAAPVEFSVFGDPRTVVARDLDGDGFPDLVVVCQGTSSLAILRNRGTGKTITENSFLPAIELRTGANPEDVAIGDLDGDGKPDLATANLSGASISVYRNVSQPGSISTSSFEPRIDLPAPYHSLCMVIGDLDGDSRPELVFGSWKEGKMLSVYPNLSRPGRLSAGSFGRRLDFPAGGRVHNVALGDFNGDGKPDVVLVTEMPDQLVVFQNQSLPGAPGRTSLGSPVKFLTGANSIGVAVVDLDGDQRPDIIFANAYSNSISIFQNLSPCKQP